MFQKRCTFHKMTIHRRTKMDDINCDPGKTNDNGDIIELEPGLGTSTEVTPDPPDPSPDYSYEYDEPTAPVLIEADLNPDLVTENGILGTKDTAQEIWDGIEEPPLMSKMFEEDIWHIQDMPDTCAIVSQEYILDSCLERDFTEKELVNHAIEKGYYTPGCGTFMYDVGNLLEDYDFTVERTEGNNFNDILEKLNNNQKIIVGVDSNEIWANSSSEQLKDLFFMPEANHAVQVIGYNNESQTVILNDPGHPDGKGMEVNLHDFEEAWQDSNNFMVSAKPPSSASVA
jgi:Peptidase_C39 like family